MRGGFVGGRRSRTLTRVGYGLGACVRLFVVCGVSVGACVNNGSIRGGEEQPESDIAGENKRDTRQCHWQLRNTSIRW